MSINYYNINNYQPFFGCDNKQMEELREKIGYEASTKIQKYYRTYQQHKTRLKNDKLIN